MGFNFAQKATKVKEADPDILLNSGSTLWLFKDKVLLDRILDPKSKLMMETNAGRKVIKKKGEISGFGEVWYDPEAMSNLIALNDLVERGHRVTYDSDVANKFIVWVRDKKKKVLRTIEFQANSKGLYVKEKEDAMKS